MSEENTPIEQKEGKDLVTDGFLRIEASTPADKVPYEIELPEDAGGRVTAGFDFPVGENIEEDIEMYGEETVRDLWLRQLVVKAQAGIRRELSNGTHPNDIAEAMSGWRPDVQHTVKKDPKASIKSDFSKLSPEEKAELLALLSQQAQ